MQCPRVVDGEGGGGCQGGGVGRARTIPWMTNTHKPNLNNVPHGTTITHQSHLFGERHMYTGYLAYKRGQNIAWLSFVFDFYFHGEEPSLMPHLGPELQKAEVIKDQTASGTVLFADC